MIALGIKSVDRPHVCGACGSGRQRVVFACGCVAWSKADGGLAHEHRCWAHVLIRKDGTIVERGDNT